MGKGVGYSFPLPTASFDSPFFHISFLKMTAPETELDEPLPAQRITLRLAGFGVTFELLALVIGIVNGEAALDGPRVVSTFIGFILVGAALSNRPDLRLIWILASVSALLAVRAIPASWDSLRLVALALAGAALLGLLVLAIPLRRRLTVGSMLIVLHFLGIYTAITGANERPWLFSQLWARFYRPYLQFTNLDNAYQFFAPDPGARPNFGAVSNTIRPMPTNDTSGW